MNLDYRSLISSSFTNHTDNVLANDNSEELTFYFEDRQKTISIDLYDFIENREILNYNYTSIISLGHSLVDKETYRSILSRLDKLIDLDFRELNHNNGSDIDIYCVSYSSNWQSNTVGEAIAQTSQAGSWWDIFWMDNDGKSSINNNDINTFIHELGHSLGLSHPNEDPYDKSYTTADTVMSYNPSVEGFNTWFSNVDIQALQNIWGRENDEAFININGNSNKFKYKRIANKYYLITENRDEELTGINEIIFTNKSINIEKDIVSIFDLIVEIDDITGEIFRLYNSALGRFPDLDGFKYWISMQQSGQNTYRQIASSFVVSKEFNTLYGDDLTIEDYVKTLYQNVLNREPDTNGLIYWSNRLEGNFESRAEVLMGFSESVENKALFMNTMDLM